MTEVQANVRYKFSGHETFPFRYTWLTKGIQRLLEYPDLFGRDDAMTILGVGKNMVASIRHWCDALGLIEPAGDNGHSRPTPLGASLFGLGGWDPYLEDHGTLWLLHWLLTGRQDILSTWHLVFTRFNNEYFTHQQLVDWLLKRIIQPAGVRATASSVRRDVDVFLRTYLPAQTSRKMVLEDSFECPLVELGLIRSIEHDLYQFTRGPKPSLPTAIFIYALIDFWRRTASQQRTLAFEAILHGAGSPGAAFKLTENALAERLESLPRWSHLGYSDTAGRRIVLRTGSQTGFYGLSALTQHYNKVAAARRL